MLKQFVVLGVMVAAATTAFAVERGQVEKAILLNDGSSVYVFKDGRMAMEDKFGRVVPMEQGQIMQTRDGQSVRMVGNETARLDWIRRSQLGGR